MTLYEVAAVVAAHRTKQAYASPEEYGHAGTAGAIIGGTGGAAAGALIGHGVASHLGKATRAQLLGIPIPGTGVGERMLSYNRGPVAGELMGALAGGAAGGSLGKHMAELKALRSGGQPHSVVHNGQVDPRLLQYLSQG